MNLTASGDTLAYVGGGTNPTEVQVANNLQTGAINASIYKGGKMLALKTSIAPKQKAVFQFKPTIWIGVTSEVEQGQVMNSAIISSINTEMSLLGIASADIVLTGGGPGPTRPRSSSRSPTSSWPEGPRRPPPHSRKLPAARCCGGAAGRTVASGEARDREGSSVSEMVKRAWSALDGRLVFDIAINRNFEDGDPSLATVRSDPEGPTTRWSRSIRGARPCSA